MFFPATITVAGEGDIAIDDVVVNVEHCPTPGPPTTTLPWLTHPDQKPTKGDCDFEEGYVTS